MAGATTFLSADVRIAGGDVQVGGRFNDQNKLSYRLSLAKDGGWRLNYQDRALASGRITGFDGSSWHNLKIAMDGKVIRGAIDGKQVAEVTDDAASAGMAYLASTYDPNLFDNVRICSSVNY